MLFLAHGHVVLGGLHVGPGRSVLRGGEQFAHLRFADGPAGLIGPDAAPGGEDLVQGRAGRLLTLSRASGEGKQGDESAENDDSFHGERKCLCFV